MALGVAPQGSHGSVLAQLRHTARQVTGSLRDGTPRHVSAAEASPASAAIASPVLLSAVVSLTRDRVPRHSACFPPAAMKRHLLPSPGSRWHLFPCFDGTMRCSDSLPPVTPHFVSFMRRLPPLAPVFVSPAKSDADLGPGGVGVWHLPAQASLLKTWRRQGVPSSWGILMCLRPALRPRRDPHYQALAVGGHGPTHIVPRGLSTRGYFGAQSHGIGTRCLRFAVRLTPPHARLASGCGPRSTRRDWIPAGFQRKVSEMLLTSLPPSPSFLAQTMTPFLPLFFPFSSPLNSTTDPFFRFAGDPENNTNLQVIASNLWQSNEAIALKNRETKVT